MHSKTVIPAACLGVLGAMLLGLYVFPENAGQDPHHVHIVVGGTPGQRARALAFHLLQEREGIDGAQRPMMPGPTRRTGSTDVHVLSIRGNDHGGAAVLSAGSSGAVLLAAIPQVPIPSRTLWTPTSPPSETPQTALPTPDPPPRDV